MVQRKHLVLIFIIIFLYPNIAYSGAWLLEPGKYKSSSSVFSVSKETRKLQKHMNEFRVYLLKEIEEIHRYARMLGRKLTLNEQRELQELEELLNNCDGFNDDILIKSAIEYGINSKYTIGLTILHIQENNLYYKCNQDFNNDYYLKKDVAREFSFYLKHSLYSSDKLQFSVVPSLIYKKINKNSKNIGINIGTYVGITKISKSGKKTISEFGFVAGKNFNYGYEDSISKKFSFFEGVEIGHGFSINSYSEYSFISNGNIFYKSLFYEQVGIAKEFAIGKNRQAVTAQIGYYWKTSLVDQDFVISGPVVSIWTNL